MQLSCEGPSWVCLIRSRKKTAKVSWRQQAGRVSKSQGGKTSGVLVARPEELTAAKTVDEIGGLG